MNEFIPISVPSITEKEISYVNDAVKSTWISSLGKYIDRFEEEFAAFCDARYAVALMNGTVAIQLALEALGIGPGDEVIVPDLSFIATANAVLYVGATPVFVDIEEETYCIDPEKIEDAITPRTKAILPVHLYGHPADMVRINEIAKKHHLVTIEDAAEAHGATINNKRVGSWSDASTFSFYGNKNLTTGEGGMVVTDSKEVYERCKFLRDHAMSKEKRYYHPEKGYNFRMTNIQAALGCAQLERSAELLNRKKEIFNLYSKYLAGNSKLILNQTKEWATNAYWLVIARIKGIGEAERDKLIADLKANGIDSRPFFHPMSSMPYLKEYKGNDLPITYKIYKEGINLPTYFDIKESEIRFICEMLSRLVC